MVGEGQSDPYWRHDDDDDDNPRGTICSSSIDG